MQDRFIKSVSPSKITCLEYLREGKNKEEIKYSEVAKKPSEL